MACISFIVTMEARFLSGRTRTSGDETAGHAEIQLVGSSGEEGHFARKTTGEGKRGIHGVGVGNLHDGFPDFLNGNLLFSLLAGE
jgi:hypothetical protein